MKKKKKVPVNYLDYIPEHTPGITDTADSEQQITLYVKNTGFFHFLAQKLLKKPPVSQIHLDEMGSFLWPMLNGELTIYEIAQSMKEQFGEKAEPLYDRLLQYLHILENSGMIIIKKPEMP